MNSNITRGRKPFRGAKIIAAVTAGSLAAFGIGSAAFAGENDESRSSAKFLGGSLLANNVDLDSIAALAGVSALNEGSAADDTQVTDLDLTALSALNVTISEGLQSHSAIS